MNCYARLVDGVVAEVVELDPSITDITKLYNASLTFVGCDSTVQVGYTYDGKAFAAPPPSPPIDPKVSAQQTLTALDAILPRCVEDLITATGVDVTKLPTQMQERLAAKQAARAVIAEAK